jgi:hypothetical protein
MNEYFFSDRNIHNILLKLEKKVNIKKEKRQACINSLQIVMEDVFTRHSNKKNKHIPLHIFIEKLNNKSLSNFMKLYQDRLKQIKQNKNDNVRDSDLYDKNSINQYEMERQMERTSQQPIGVIKRPEYTQQHFKQKEEKKTELPGTLSDVGGSYASFSNDTSGGFIGATGEAGKQMQITDLDYEDSSKNPDELEKRLMTRQQEYAQKSGAADMIGSSINHNSSSEINFALDGGDSRNTIEKNNYVGKNNNMMDNNVNIMQNDDMMGFDSLSGLNNNFFNNLNNVNDMGHSSMQSNDPMMGIPQQNNNPMMDMQQQNNNPMMDMQQQNNNPMMDMQQQNNNPMMDMQQQNNNPTMGRQQQNNNPMMDMQQQNNNPIMNMQQNNNPTMGMQQQNNNPTMGMQQQNNNPTMGMQQQNNNPTIGMQQQNNNPTMGMQNNNDDLDIQMNKLITERKNINIDKSNKKFNPMVSPNMDNNNVNMNSMNIDKMLEMQQQYNNSINSINKKNFSHGGKQNNNKTRDGTNLNLNKVNIMSVDEINSLVTDMRNTYNKINNTNTTQIVDNCDIKNKYANILDETKKNLQHGIIKENNKGYEINVNCETYASKEDYSDYMIELDNKINNINSIEIKDCEFPLINTNINNNNNQLEIEFNNENKIIELESGEYDLYELLEGIQDAFDQENIKILISKDRNGKIKFELNDHNDNFIIYNKQNSLCKLFGFTKEIYSNNYKYISENIHKFYDNAYIYIDNISQTDPIGEIEFNKQNNIIKYFDNNINNLDFLIIKIKNNKTDSEDLVNFKGINHKFKLIINN